VKETPKGYWIGDWLFKKWIPKDSKKRFAYPTKEEALNNFIIRTKKYIEIIKSRLDDSKYAIILAEGEMEKISNIKK